MREITDWKEDPIVLLEKQLYPLLPRLLRHCAPGHPSDPRMARQVRVAAETLRSAQSRLFDPLEIKLAAPVSKQLARMADRLEGLVAALDRFGMPDACGFLSLDALTGAFADEIEVTLDALRADYLGEVMRRHVRARNLASLAAREVNSISRQIYFISINASVEAARAGEAGRGFAVIGEQIRTLSQDASTALRRLEEQGSTRE